MILALQTAQPFIVTIVEKPARHTSLLDIVLGSLWVVGASVVLAVVLGALLAWVLVSWNRRHPPELGHLPPVSPLVRGSGAPGSSQAR